MQHAGKIIRIRNRYPGTPTLVVSTVGEGFRKHLNLCFSCKRFNPDTPAEHCSIAQQVYDFSLANSVAFAMVRCGTFEPCSGIVVSDNSGSPE